MFGARVMWFGAVALVACATPAGKTQPYVASVGIVGDDRAPPPIAATTPTAPSAATAPPDTITATVTALRSDAGTIRCYLYDDGADFPDSKAHVIAAAVALPAARAATCTFAGVHRDRDYAIVILHDENNDNVFQKGAFGIPQEGYGFSNNPRVRLSAPSYDACKFHFTSGALALAITTLY